jgi:hypothetical protein
MSEALGIQFDGRRPEGSSSKWQHSAVEDNGNQVTVVSRGRESCSYVQTSPEQETKRCQYCFPALFARFSRYDNFISEWFNK